MMIVMISFMRQFVWLWPEVTESNTHLGVALKVSDRSWD